MRLKSRLLLQTVVPLVVFVIILIMNATMALTKIGKGMVDKTEVTAHKSYEIELEHLVDQGISLLKTYQEKVDDGLLSETDAMEEVYSLIQNIRYDDGRGYLFIISNEQPVPVMIMHAISPTLNGKELSSQKYFCATGNHDGENLFVAMVDEVKESSGGVVEYKWADPNNKEQTLPKMSFVKHFEPWDVIVGTGVYIDDIEEIVADQQAFVDKSIRESSGHLVLIALICFIVVFIGVLLLTKALVVRIKKLSDGLADVAKGDADLSARLDVSSKDELGDMARHFNLFAEKLEGQVDDIKKSSETLNSSGTILADMSLELNNQADDLNRRSVAIHETTERFRSTMDQLADSADGINSNLQDVSSESLQANEMLSNVTLKSQDVNEYMLNVASSMGEISITIGDIARNAEDARAQTSQSRQKVLAAQSTAERLDVSTKEINNIVNTIFEIAEQTKLLALNATIEAARAGESGKGFAVVASEVKELANQTASATSSIQKQIIEIQTTSHETVEMMNDVVSGVNGMADVLSSIATAVEEQSVVSNEVNTSVQDTASLFTQMTDAFKDVVGRIDTLNSAVMSASGEVEGITKNIAKNNDEVSIVSEEAKALKANGAQVSKQSNLVHSTSNEVQCSVAELKKVIEEFSA